MSDHLAADDADAFADFLSYDDDVGSCEYRESTGSPLQCSMERVGHLDFPRPGRGGNEPRLLLRHISRAAAAAAACGRDADRPCVHDSIMSALWPELASAADVELGRLGCDQAEDSAPPRLPSHPASTAHSGRQPVVLRESRGVWCMRTCRCGSHSRACATEGAVCVLLYAPTRLSALMCACTCAFVVIVAFLCVYLCLRLYLYL